MKLDEIQDIEVLRNELKKRMVKCIKTTEKEICKFNEGEYYYYFEFNELGEDLYYVDYENGIIFSSALYNEKDFEQYFEFPKEGDS